MNRLQILVRLKWTKTSIYLFLLLQVCRIVEIHLDANMANISPNVFHHKPSITACNFSAFELIKLTKLHSRKCISPSCQTTGQAAEKGWLVPWN